MFALHNGDTWRFDSGVQYELSPREYAHADGYSDLSRLLGGDYKVPTWSSCLHCSYHFYNAVTAIRTRQQKLVGRS